MSNIYQNHGPFSIIHKINDLFESILQSKRLIWWFTHELTILPRRTMKVECRHVVR
jgi:hypothetical protein